MAKRDAHQPLAIPPDPRVLLIRLKSIGDILFTLPAVHVIRENFPGAKITFLVSREHAPLMEGFRDVDEVLPLDRAIYRQGNLKVIATETLGLLRRLRRGQFTLTVDFQGYGETALLTWYTRAPERWGNVHQTMRRRAYTRCVRPDRRVHPAEANVSLLQQCGLPAGRIRNEFVLPATALEQARRLIAALGIDDAQRVLFIQPFTSKANKNWPLEYWLALARHWRGHGVQVLFGGGPADREALEPARRAGYPVSAGASLLVTAGLMKLCTVIVGGDTGLLHLAVAMNKRVVMLMASARARTLPFQHADWAIIPPERESVGHIETDTAIAACARAFA
ncbi:MAG: glycosyltransferase family 9 protein [Verrucomicrobiota bacterium]|jgi:ADP-heptose:LPS heptosyltransferase